MAKICYLSCFRRRPFVNKSSCMWWHVPSFCVLVTTAVHLWSKSLAACFQHSKYMFTYSRIVAENFHSNSATLHWQICTKDCRFCCRFPCWFSCGKLKKILYWTSCGNTSLVPCCSMYRMPPFMCVWLADTSKTSLQRLRLYRDWWGTRGVLPWGC